MASTCPWHQYLPTSSSSPLRPTRTYHCTEIRKGNGEILWSTLPLISFTSTTYFYHREVTALSVDVPTTMLTQVGLLFLFTFPFLFYFLYRNSMVMFNKNLKFSKGENRKQKESEHCIEMVALMERVELNWLGGNLWGVGSGEQGGFLWGSTTS